MSERLRRIGSIVRADLLIRFRRTSTLVVFLLLSFSTYLWVPDPSSGFALLSVDGRRAVYSSAAIAIATALLGTIVVGLIGFYVVSNAVATDLRTCCGLVIASTTMGRSDYVVAKFLGNVAFLSTFMAGYMVASMAMVVVRGEGALEPMAFVVPYLLLAPPVVTFVAAAAVTFETFPGLGGRLGDVVWFFLWILLATVPAMILDQGHGSALVGYVDFSGLGYVMRGLEAAFSTTRISIGASPFDPAKGLVVVQGLPVAVHQVASRVVAAVIPLLMLPISCLCFHRFDPARVRQRRNPLGGRAMAAIRRAVSPLARVAGVLRVHRRRAGASLWTSAREDAFVTIRSAPLLAVAIPVIVIVSLALPIAILRTGLLPLVFALIAVLVAGVATRERRHGLLALVYAAPGLKPRFVWFKLATMVLVSLTLVGVPLVRLALADANASALLLLGTLFTCAVALALGILSSNPKTFLVLYFIFGYAVVNDGGHTPALDFAGFYGAATPAVAATYLATTIVLVALAQVWHAARLRREG